MKKNVIAFAFFLLATFPCAALSADTTSYRGVQTHFGQYNRTDMDSVSMEAQLDLILAAGFQAIRDECYWSDVEKERGVYSFPKQIDDYIRAAQRRGISVLLILNYNNPLYAPHAGSQMITDSNRTAYGKYCAEVVKRYSPLGVKQYELWNEPNLPMFWDPSPNASAYVKMIKAVYPQLKKIDSSITLIGCATSPLEGQPLPNIPWTNFISGVVSDSGLFYMDAVSFHQYRVDKAPEIWLNNDIQTAQLLTANSKPIWLTEVGYHTSSLWPYTTASMQADYLTRMYLLGYANPNLKRISYYDFKNDGTLGNNAEHNFGIVNYDRSPKPAYTALKTMFGVIQKKSFKGLSVVQDNYTAAFGETGSKVFAVWNPTAATQRLFSVGSQSCYLIDRDGTRKLIVTKDSNITVLYSASPKYIVQVSSVSKLKSFRIEPKTLSLDTSQSVAFILRGEDTLSNPAEISSAMGTWKVLGNAGTIDATGKFRAAKAGTATIIAEFSGLTDTAKVTVFIPSGSIGMNDFADPSQWSYSVSNLDSVETKYSISIEQASTGTTSGKLQYSFKHKSGLGVSSYRVFLQTDQAVPGNPDSMMIDVYSNGEPHRIEFRFRDAYGEYFSKTAADQPTNWLNVWKTVKIWMKGFGSAIDYPISLDRITVYTVPSQLVVDSTYKGTIYLDNLRAKFIPATFVAAHSENDIQYNLFQNYPNPFNPYTKIPYSIPSQSFVSLKIFDLLGNEIRTLVSENQSAGSYVVDFSGGGNTLASGLYFYRLTANNHVSVRKMVYMK